MINYLLEHFLEVISIIVALIIFYFQLRKKSLVYSILTNSKVISVSDPVRDAVQVLYKGTVVSNVRLIEIRINNKGNLSIKPDDYTVPLILEFPDETKILSLEIIDPYSLGVQTNIEKSNIKLNNILLNPKDFFYYQTTNWRYKCRYLASWSHRRCNKN